MLDSSQQNVIEINKLLSKLLFARGYDSKEKINKFLFPKLDDLIDPYCIDSMSQAVDLILTTIHNKKKILIYGDYDVDGVTALVIMYRFFKTIGCCDVSYDVANRFEEGYGLAKKSIMNAIENNVSLIITVDCGIKDLEAVFMAKKHGINVIITDHHIVGDVLPEADVVINPKKNNNNTLCHELSGGGVVFKLIQAICKKMMLFYNKNIFPLLALSTACDIVPLINENRVIVTQGLQQFKDSMLYCGVKALLDVNNVSTNVTMYDILFKLGPCINSAGRINTARKAIDLLLSDNEEESLVLAKEIKTINDYRKELCITTFTKAKEMIDEKKNINILYDATWHRGILGIVASRCVEYNNKPTIILTDDKDEILIGSARSIKGYDLYSALKSCSELLLAFGGHSMAAGMKIKKNMLEDFKMQINNIVGDNINNENIYNTPQYDLEINIEDIDVCFCQTLKLMQPFGMGNENPIFKSVVRFYTLNETEYNLILTIMCKNKEIKSMISKNITSKIQLQREYTIYYNILLKIDNSFYFKILAVE